MPVPTLPVTQLPAPLGLFKFMDYGGEALADLLVVVTFIIATAYYLWLFITRIHGKCTASTCAVGSGNGVTCVNSSHRLMTWRHRLRKWRDRFLSSLADGFIAGSRKLNVLMFPGLFTKHKGRHTDLHSKRTVTKVFILFLDRKVEDNREILLTFYFLSLAIFSSALLVFFRYFPVEIGSECLERDDQDRDVFCYTITGGSSWPVDCDTYNTTELEEIEFLCYTISIPSIGIALAAAAALAKLATVCITFYIRVSEAVYMWSQENDGGCATKCYVFYHSVVFILLISVASVSSMAVALILQSRWQTDEGHLSKRVYFAYAVLPILLFCSLIVIIFALGKHCNLQEYISFSKDQLPTTEEHRHEYDEHLAIDIHEHEDSENGENNRPLRNVSDPDSINTTRTPETRPLLQEGNGNPAYGSRADSLSDVV